MQKRYSKYSKPRHSSRAASSVTPSMQGMAAMLKQAEISLAPEGLQKLWRYHNLIRKHNQDRELTRLIGFESMVVKHYIDCLIVGNLWRIPSPVVDIGTGAGFPGVPLKIRYPNLEVILAEPRPKRIAFLNEVIRDLDLKNTTVFEHKVVSRSFTTPVKAVITRAVETLDKTFLRSSGAVRPGTQLIFLKGPNCDDEIQSVKKRFAGYFELINDTHYQLPGTQFDRRLVVYECKKPLVSVEDEDSLIEEPADL